jgi:hypothetical protein
MTQPLHSPHWRFVYGAPLGIAFISCLGFVAAFLFGALGQWLCWAGLGLPIAIILWVLLRELSHVRED